MTRTSPRYHDMVRLWLHHHFGGQPALIIPELPNEDESFHPTLSALEEFIKTLPNSPEIVPQPDILTVDEVCCADLTVIPCHNVEGARRLWETVPNYSLYSLYSMLWDGSVLHEKEPVNAVHEP